MRTSNLGCPVSDPKLEWKRESRFWQTTAEVALTVCVGMLLFASVVIR